MEFSDLLDGISPGPPASTEPDLSLAELVMFPVPRVAEQRPESVPHVAEEQAEAGAIVDAQATAEVPALMAEVTVDVVVVEQPPVSRFERAGIDDDLLPVRTARRRRLHR